MKKYLHLIRAVLLVLIIVCISDAIFQNIEVLGQTEILDFRSKLNESYQGYPVFLAQDGTKQIYLTDGATNERTWYNINGIVNYDNERAIAPTLDTRILKLYKISVYADGGNGVTAIPPSEQKFMKSADGLDVQNGNKGEYKYLGYKPDGGTPVTNDRYFSDESRFGKATSLDYKYYIDSAGKKHVLEWIEPPVSSTLGNVDYFIQSRAWKSFDDNCSDAIDRSLFTLTNRVKVLLDAPFFDSESHTGTGPIPNLTLKEVLAGPGTSDANYVTAMKKAVLLTDTTMGFQTRLAIRLWYRVPDLNKVEYNTVFVDYQNYDDLVLTLDSVTPTALHKGDDATVKVKVSGILSQNLPGTDVVMWVNDVPVPESDKTYSDSTVNSRLSSEVHANAAPAVLTFTIPDIRENSSVKISINSSKQLSERDYLNNTVYTDLTVSDTATPSPPPPVGNETSINPNAVIKADNRDAERFDVTKGIPSNESVYVNVITQEYQYHFESQIVSGTASYTVNVTHPDDEGEETVTPVSVTKSYSYYVVSSFDFYTIDSATINNAALPGGKAILTPANYTPPTAYYADTGDVDTGASTVSVTSSSSNPATIEAAANAAVSPTVSNDTLTIGGKTILGPNTPPESTPHEPAMIGRDVLYVKNIRIPAATRNGSYTSSGTLTYKLTKAVHSTAAPTKTVSIPSINAVKVHTPVYAGMTVSDDAAHNQMVNPSASASAIILSRPFTLNLSNAGQHLNIPGYGNRDYTAYIKDRQIYLPFDAYLGTNRDGTYLRGNAWYSLTNLGIGLSENTVTLYTPTWVQEGSYNIQMRALALNDTSGGSNTETNANLNIAHTVASVSKPVEVSGRVYDLKVTDVQDYAWELFFRKVKGKPEATGKAFYTGNSTINGTVDSKRTYTFPIMPGKNDVKGYDKLAVKLGYPFRFELTTIGGYEDAHDYVRIMPAFYFVDKNGKNRQEVDLYYSTPKTPMIRVGDTVKDTLQNSMKLNFLYRGIPAEEFSKTAEAMYQLRGGINGFTLDSWKTAFPKISQNGVLTYAYNKILMSEPIRSYIGPLEDIPANIGNNLSLASVQKWYGEFALPPDCLAVPKGTDLSKQRNLTPNSPVFLKNGHIIVNFKDIAVIRNDDFENPVLQYTGKTGDGWALENYNHNQNGWELLSGDVMVYYADKRSTEDINSTGTH